MSIRLSQVINRTAPVIAESIPTWKESDLALARQLVVDHLPPILIEVAGEHVCRALPERYVHWLMANRLASGIAYREGIEFMADMESEAVIDLALNYLRRDMDLRKLISRVSESDLPDRERVITLLLRGGVRAALNDL